MGLCTLVFAFKGGKRVFPVSKQRRGMDEKANAVGLGVMRSPTRPSERE